MCKKLRVAIFQNTITGGGRIQVLNEMIAILNELKIIPDLFTLRVNPSFQKKGELQFNIIKIPQYIRGFYELKIIHLNWLMRSRSKKYDLLINSNNSLLFAPSEIPTIAYIYFPREMRVLTDYASLAFPDGFTMSEKNFSFRLYRKFLRRLYRLRKYTENNLIIADSNFTKEMFLHAYPECPRNSVKVIYPPVDIQKWQTRSPKRANSVASLGRFCDEKRQLEQIQIAEKLPEFQFVLIGYVGDPESRNYFKQCQNYIQKNDIKNVLLFQNLPQNEAIQKLQASQFFLHNLRNEPFGLSTVEAIAAGCVPIVTNSGGQTEIVPYEELRFNDMDEAIDKLKNIHQMDLNAILQKLQHQILQYDQAHFRSGMKEVLENQLN